MINCLTKRQFRTHSSRYAKFLFVFAFFCAAQFSAHAQSNLEAYAGYVKNLNKNFKASAPGFGFRFEWGNSEARFTKYAGIGFALPMKATDAVEARAFSNQTSPSYVPVDASYSQSMYRLELGARYYFVGNAFFEEGFNWYVNGAAELIYMNNKPTYSQYDKSKYTLGYTDDSSVNPDGTDKKDINFHIGLGTGFEKQAGPGFVVLQAAISFPATTVNSQDVSDNLTSMTPIPVFFNIGYKFPLGGGN